MEAWRVIAAVLVAVGGVVLVLLTMAKVRERKGGATSGQVALSGAITFTVLALLCVLVLTVLSPWLTWAVVVIVGVVVSVMLLAS